MPTQVMLNSFKTPAKKSAIFISGITLFKFTFPVTVVLALFAVYISELGWFEPSI